MKNIIPSLNQFALACQDNQAPLSDIAKHRQALLSDIKLTILEAIKVGGTKQSSAIDKFVESFDDKVLGIKKIK
jgi:hypothetical protein